MNASLFHRLEGNNFYFKKLEISDCIEIHKYASDIDVSRFIGWNLMNNLDETQEYVKEMIRREVAGTHMYASIVLKSTKEIIGNAMVFNFDFMAKHAEIGYVFHKDFWGNSYGTETVGIMTNYLFESLKLHKVHSHVVSGNIGSIRIMEKNGFSLEGRIRDYHFIENVYYDRLCFGKLQNNI
ncbi:GNAT family N-acetyltransferase [Serpentinicella alkaliphila]|uniref:Ribosomal-protein-alanine N-acetyltransferase n=1 Tax=Serpentinicella alkaliphila TaxID=1734049 RepID=A0A4R2TXY1_9FIRM|nr:GNAT family N-acetyltransferase [Serpentinicella alkaliphila]QUH26876.1 GNAT family N-acetyltransferase [Serpentinicella alkaliphila]TCQ08106.1 ribosomal-protein-alanine N-acetyltransferase [Serpentinicella alkaliphila]